MNEEYLYQERMDEGECDAPNTGFGEQKLDLDAIELKPCPYCGGRAEIHCDNGAFYVGCIDCFMRGPEILEVRAEAEKDAIAVWNKLPRALHFSKEKPKVEGMYWCRCIDPRTKIADQADIMYFTPEGNTLGCKWMELYDEFAGPIPEPQEKK